MQQHSLKNQKSSKKSPLAKGAAFLFMLLFLNIMSLPLSTTSWGFEENFDVNYKERGRWGPLDDDGRHMGFHSPHVEERAKMKFLYTGVSRLESASQYAHTTTYVIAGIGMLGLVILAFMGKFQWPWLVSLCGGLLLMAGLQSVIQFLY
ncbi:MAG: hypothetical protein ACTSXQ_07065 [Alphaproteobacteria bacterium]